MRNALAHVPQHQHTVVAAAIRQALLQPDHRAASEARRHVAGQLRARWPKLGSLMDEAAADVLAYLTFLSQHRTKLHGTGPLERLDKEVKRRADVAGLFPNEPDDDGLDNLANRRLETVSDRQNAGRCLTVRVVARGRRR